MDRQSNGLPECISMVAFVCLSQQSITSRKLERKKEKKKPYTLQQKIKNPHITTKNYKTTKKPTYVNLTVVKPNYVNLREDERKRFSPAIDGKMRKTERYLWRAWGGNRRQRKRKERLWGVRCKKENSSGWDWMSRKINDRGSPKATKDKCSILGPFGSTKQFPFDPRNEPFYLGSLKEKQNQSILISKPTQTRWVGLGYSVFLKAPAK